MPVPMPRRAFGLFVALVALGCSGGDTKPEHRSSVIESISLPTGFAAETVINNLNMPTSMRFANDGRIFIAEKGGTIKVFDGLSDTTPTLVADLSTEVYDYWDRGLLDIAIDQQWPTRPYLYALYTLDGKLGDSVAAGTVPRYHDDCTVAYCPAAGRLVKLQLDPTTGVMLSKTTLIENWGQQFPSHSIGSLVWGPDGFLYISGGEGASFDAVDYGNTDNPLGDPPTPNQSLSPPSAMGGALRSQVITPPPANPAFPTWFNGKVIRVDPSTMTPMLDPKTVPAPSPVVAYGLRNPFRMTFKPGTNELWVGDVGWNYWEEINRIPNATSLANPPNFGWPCYEGNEQTGGYSSAGLTLCTNLYNAASAVKPHFTYSHGVSTVNGDGCGSGGASTTGVAFYNGTNYPQQYQGALFFTDYTRNCTWYMPPDANGVPDPTKPTAFASGIGSPVQLQMGPDQDLYFVDIGGMIKRYHFQATNHAPQAVISANALSGPLPLTINFSAAGSTDGDAGDTLSYAWDLNGDGVFNDSTSINPTYTYTTGAAVTVGLRVTDNHGASTLATTVVRPGQNAPVPKITLTSSPTWHTGTTITLHGSATDVEDGTLPATSLQWSIILQHCPLGVCHTHVLTQPNGVADVSLLGPDHDYPSHIDVTLTVLDSTGLSGTTTLSLQPDTTAVTVNTQPSGLNVAISAQSGASPQSLTVITAATTTVSAPDQFFNGKYYMFQSWSDGGAATHTINPTQPTQTLTATYQISTAPPPPTNITAGGTPIAFITAPTGGGNKDINVIMDGVKPAVGSTDSSQQYDTWNSGGARATDWIGYNFAAPQTFTSVVFQEGKNFSDGGAFVTGSLIVQVRSGGVWNNVSAFTSTPPYTGNNGVNYETFTLSFTPATGDGIRIFGTPQGTGAFISVGELEVDGYPSTSTGPTNNPPTAAAGPDQTVNLGAAVTLNGSSSSDPEGAAITYQWSQVAGPTVTLQNATSATPTFTAPSTATTLTFQLVVNDGTQSSAADTVVITVVDPNSVNLAANGTPIALITAPTGGGNKNLNVIKDGIKPAVGSTDSSQQYDTWNGGGARANDWIGYSFTAAQTFNRVVFQEGKNFSDGGAFVTGSLTVQVRSGGVWNNVAALTSTPTYPGNNGVNYETYTLSFTPTQGTGVRIYGTPGGSAKFISVGELEAYAQ